MSEAFNEKQPITARMWRASILIASQSFLYGYIFAALNPCLVFGNDNEGSNCYDGSDTSCPPGTIYNDFNLSTFETSLATGLIVLGGWIGSMFGGSPSDKYGRKPTLLANTLFFIVGAALSASGNLNAFFIGRFISGIGVGVVSGLSPLLLSEIADNDNKGVITTMCQLLLTAGIFLAAMIGYAFVSNTNHGWQYVLGLQAVPAFVILIFSSYVPESPKWLIRNNRSEEAMSILVSLRPQDHDCLSELAEIEAENSSSSNALPTWSELLKHKKALMIGCSLMFFNAFTGINTVIFYSTTIFGFAGFDEAILATASVDGLNFIMTVLAVYLIDRLNRKTLLLTGQYVMLLSLILLGVILLSSTSAQGAIAVIAVLCYIAGFATSLGAVVWVIMSEIMSNRLRAKAMSLFLSISWACNLVIALSTLPAIDGLGGATDDMTDDAKNDADKKGVAKLYFIFMVFSIISIIFGTFMIPETKGSKMLVERNWNPLSNKENESNEDYEDFEDGVL